MKQPELHTRLLGVLRLIRPTLPTDATPLQAWEAIRPGKGPFLSGSFWQVLSCLQFARDHARQKKIAEWIYRQKERAEKAGRTFPPKPIKVKPAFTPQPHT